MEILGLSSIYEKLQADDHKSFTDFKEWMEDSTIKDAVFYGNSYDEQGELQGSVSAVLFTNNIDEHYAMYHEQDCCETVEVDGIYGDLVGIKGNNVVSCDRMTFSGPNHTEKRGYYEESVTVSIYKIVYRGGEMTIKWYGESNGYYDESVGFRTMIQKVGDGKDLQSY